MRLRSAVLSAPSMSLSNSVPSDGCVVRTLQDGFWDLTEIIELADGSRRVRKRCKGASVERPWGVESLRREMRYLRTLSPAAARVLPTLLAGWDRIVEGLPDVGYEMPYYFDHKDVGTLARTGAFDQDEVDIFQGELADAIYAAVHEPGQGEEPLSRHMVTAVRQSLDGLVSDPSYAALINAPTIELNGRGVLGPRAIFEKLIHETDVLRRIDGIPSVRLHGDLHLENILWRPLAVEGAGSRLILVDPVSVAGVVYGPPLWDLVKYESYATGELVALRKELIEVSGLGNTMGRYGCRIREEDEALAPFHKLNWHGLFREAFISQHGRVDQCAYRFIHGYFNAAMALNTSGTQRLGRLLRATEDFNATMA